MESAMTFSTAIDNLLELRIVFKNEIQKNKYVDFLTETTALWSKYQEAINREPKGDHGFAKFIIENL
jgi:hypothetical protein